MKLVRPSQAADVFWRQRSCWNSSTVTPTGESNRRGAGKVATLNKYLTPSRKWYKMYAEFLWKANRKSYALYQMITLPISPNQPYFYVFGLPSKYLWNGWSYNLQILRTGRLCVRLLMTKYLFKFWSIRDTISETVQDVDWRLTGNYVAYQMAPIGMTLSDCEGHFGCPKPF